MTKFKKIVSGTLAGCLMASALMMSAGAANVQTTVISKAGVQAAAQTAAQVRTAVKINPQSANIYVEGIPATFPSEDGKTVYTALSYNGSTYMPLRTVGRWMAKISRGTVRRVQYSCPALRKSPIRVRMTMRTTRKA